MERPIIRKHIIKTLYSIITDDFNNNNLFDDDDILQLEDEFNELRSFIDDLDIILFTEQDIADATTTYSSFGIGQLTDLETVPTTVAEKTPKGVRLTKIPQHIYRYLLDHKKQITMPTFIQYLNDDGTTTFIDKPQDHLKMLRTIQLYKPCPIKEENTDQTQTTATEREKPDNQDSGFEDNDQFDSQTVICHQSLPQNTDNVRQTDTSTKYPTNGGKADRYHTGACPARADRYTHHHHDIALTEAHEYLDYHKTRPEFLTQGLSKEVRTDMQRRIRDHDQQSNEVYSNCEQCPRDTRHRLRLERHKTAKVNILLLEYHLGLRRPIKIHKFTVPTVTTEQNKSIRAQNWALYGREAYWQDPNFYINMVQTAEQHIKDNFPISILLDLKVQVDLDPICVTYTTPHDTLYVIPAETIQGRMHEAPEPRHVYGEMYSKQEPADAEFFVSFIVQHNKAPAIQLQLRAREDELVQRLKAINLHKSSNSFIELGKVILAYAAFQEWRYDYDFQQNWNPKDSVKPVEELLDLRTQLDLNRNHRHSYDKDLEYDYNHYRPKSSSYQLRKGMQQRRQRIQQDIRTNTNTTTDLITMGKPYTTNETIPSRMDTSQPRCRGNATTSTTRRLQTIVPTRMRF
jgi:hypothetical protein